MNVLPIPDRPNAIPIGIYIYLNNYSNDALLTAQSSSDRELQSTLYSHPTFLFPSLPQNLVPGEPLEYKQTNEFHLAYIERNIV
jgi:hypothetical protein